VITLYTTRTHAVHTEISESQNTFPIGHDNGRDLGRVPIIEQFSNHAGIVEGKVHAAHCATVNFGKVFAGFI
jgi:hypothetical protein